MKKILLGFILVCSSLFSFEVNFNKSFSKVVSPDLLTTFVTVNVEKKDERAINNEIEKFNDFIKDTDLIKAKDGRYTLSPKYKYINNKQVFVAYVGSLRYKVESSNATNINSFIDELISIKNRIDSSDIKLNISNVTWQIGDELYNKSVDDLRFDIISWIENYSNVLSRKISKNCVVSKININSYNRPNIHYGREVALASAKVVSDVTPANSDEEITLNPNFVLECK